MVEKPQKVFNVAFGISDKHNSNAVVEDELYGTLQAMITMRNDDGSFAYEQLK